MLCCDKLILSLINFDLLEMIFFLQATVFKETEIHTTDIFSPNNQFPQSLSPCDETVSPTDIREGNPQSDCFRLSYSILKF